VGIEWTLCLLGGAVAAGTEPPDLADSKREHPAGCAWSMLSCPKAGEGGDTKRIMQATFFFLTGVGLFPLHSSSFWEQVRGSSSGRGPPA
jgi:hypothetical protein